MTDINYAAFPIINMYEFEYIQIDAFKIEMDEGEVAYQALLNFFMLDEDSDTGNALGFSLDTSIICASLSELASKIQLLFASGLFDSADVDAHGTLWVNGENEGIICWMSEGAIHTNEEPQAKPTLH